MRAVPVLFSLAATLGACTTENDDTCYQNPGLCDDANQNSIIDMGSGSDAMSTLDAGVKPDAIVQNPDAAQLTPDAVTTNPDAATANSDAAAPTPDAASPTPDAAAPDAVVQQPDAFVFPADSCRIKILTVIGGAGNVQVFCGPGTHQVDGYERNEILGPDSICNAQVGIANQVWVLVSPTRATFEQQGDCSNGDGGSGLTIFSGDRTNDVPTDEPPRRTAEQLEFVDNPDGTHTLVVEGAGEDIVTYFDAQGTNLNPER